MSSIQKPDCAYWKIWKGREIEGVSGDPALGEMTLFVRDMDSFTLLSLKAACPGIKRIWFCADFFSRKEENRAMTVEKATRLFDSVCVEVLSDDGSWLPQGVRSKIRVYWKFNRSFAKGDVVCVGPPYGDEFFEIGKGREVAHADYIQDTQIA